MKADQERVSKLLNDTVTLLCKNGLIYRNQLTVQGLLGITLDKNEVFIVHINETIGSPSATADAVPNRQSSSNSKAPSNVVDLTNVSDSPSVPSQAPIRFNQIQNQMPMSPRRPRMPANVLLQQMQRMRMGNYLPQGFNPGAMPFMQIPPGNPGRPTGRLPLPPALKHRQPTNQRRPTTVPVQQQSVTVSLLDEDDVVIIGTGREEPQSSSRRSQQHRGGLRPFPQKPTRTPNANNLQPIVIGQGSFSNIDMCQDDSIAPSSFSDPKNYLGEIIIEPSNINDVEEARIVSSITGTDVSATSAALIEDIRDELIPAGTSVQDSTGLAVVDRVMSPATDKREGMMVYMDVAGDDMNNVKPDPVTEDLPANNSSEPAKDQPELMDEEPINYDSVGLHMLTEDDDDDGMQTTLVPWKCKVPSCRSVFSEPALLAGHYVHNHTDQISHLTNTEVDFILKKDKFIICPDSSQRRTGLVLEPIESLISGPSLETKHGNTNNENIFEPEKDTVSFGNQCLPSSFSMEAVISESGFSQSNNNPNVITEAPSCTDRPLYDSGGLLPKDAQCSSSVSSIERDVSPCDTLASVLNMESECNDIAISQSFCMETPLLRGITPDEDLGLSEGCGSQARDSNEQPITDSFSTDASDSVPLGDCGTETCRSDEQTIKDTLLSPDITVKEE